jgi:hypothetical protein
VNTAATSDAHTQATIGCNARKATIRDKREAYMSSLSLKFDVFAGTNIDDVCCDLVAVANRTEVLCEAEFNGIILWAQHGDDPREIAKDYWNHAEGNSKTTLKIAQHRRL